MRDEDQRQLNDRAKHRLRVAARFMRQKGHRFDSGDFYEMVIAVIMSLGTVAQEKLRDLVNWVEKYEITERAIREAMQHPRAIDEHLKSAQEARRVLDRLVGYDLSGLIWKKVWQRARFAQGRLRRKTRISNTQ